MSFVNIDQTTDASALLDTGIDTINATLTANGYPGWTASDATLVVIFLTVIFQALADIANTETTATAAIWRAFGTQLMNVPYNNGQQASVWSTWTFTSPAPDSVSYRIPAGTVVVINSEFFQTKADYTANTGDTSASILLSASQVGASYNGLGGVNTVVELYQSIDWVTSVVTVGVSADGADQEDDNTYQNRLVGAAQLQAPRPVVADDYAPFVLSDITAEQTGVTVGRATSMDGYYPDGRVLSTGGTTSPTTLPCTLTSGGATVYYSGSGTQVPTVGATVSGTGVPAGATVAASPAPNDASFTLSAAATASGAESLTVSAMSGYGPQHLTCTATVTSGSASVSITAAPYTGMIPDVGARVTGAGIPAGATVAASPAPTATGFTLSTTASASGTGETLTISSWTSVPLANTTWVTDSTGSAMTAAHMDALDTFLAKYRPGNWLTNIAVPSYTTVYVTVSVHVLPTADASSVTANVQSALVSFLNPETWGNPGASSTGANEWLNAQDGYNIVRYFKLIGVVEAVQGVDYCATLKLGTAASPTGTSDLVLPGWAPLPQTTTSDIVVTTA